MSEDLFWKMRITFECDHHDASGTHRETVRYTVELHEDPDLDSVREACVNGIRAMGYSYFPKDDENP